MCDFGAMQHFHFPHHFFILFYIISIPYSEHSIKMNTILIGKKSTFMLKNKYV